MDEDMNEEFTMDPERRLQTTLGVCLGEAFCASGFVHPKSAAVASVDHIDGWTFFWAQGAPYRRGQGRR
jgi:hypothetical protein